MLSAQTLRLLGTVILPGIVGCDAAAALIGYLINVPVLYRYGPALPAMKVNAALCLLLLSVARLLPVRHLVIRAMAHVLAVAAGGIAAATLCEEFLPGTGSGVDHLIVSASSGSGAAERMAPQAAATLLILACVTVLARLRAVRWELIQAGGITVLISGGGALIGLCFGVSQVWGPTTFGGVAVPASLGVMGLGVALCVSAPERGPVGLLITPGSGGWMARMLLPVTLLLPIVMAGLLRAARSTSLINDPEAWSVMVVGGTAVPAVAVMIVAAALDRTEGRRTSAERHADRAHARLGLLADVGAVVAEATGEPALCDGVSRLLAERLDAWCGIYQAGDEDQPAPPATAGPTLAVPLVARGETVGVLHLIHQDRDRLFDVDDERVLVDVGRRIGAALDNLRLLAARTRVAALLQESLLPQRLPDVPGAEIAASYLAGEPNAEVGGDFYDAFSLGGDEYAFVIGDVSGRGVDAAGLTGLARTTLRALDASVGPAAALRRLNDLLIERTGGQRFLTAAYLRIGSRTDTGATATVCLAGHPPPVLVGHGGATQWLGHLGSLLGVFAEPSLVDQVVPLSPGDTVVLYTDGVTEADGPRGLFGDQGLIEALAPLAGRPAETVVTELERIILAYRAGAGDDTAMLALRLVPASESAQRVLIDLRLPVEITTAALAGRAVARVCEQSQLSRELAGELRVAVGDLMTTTVCHLECQPARTLRSDPIRLRVLRRSEVLRVEVHHPGSPAAPTREPRTTRAHGDRAGIDASSGATCVWFEIDLPGTPAGALAVRAE